jgi:hypothetical protein
MNDLSAFCPRARATAWCRMTAKGRHPSVTPIRRPTGFEPPQSAKIRSPSQQIRRLKAAIRTIW